MPFRRPGFFGAAGFRAIFFRAVEAAGFAVRPPGIVFFPAGFFFAVFFFAVFFFATFFFVTFFLDTFFFAAFFFATFFLDAFLFATFFLDTFFFAAFFFPAAFFLMGFLRVMGFRPLAAVFLRVDFFLAGICFDPESEKNNRGIIHMPAAH